ncbi:MAG TPA: hypothetical protein VFZ19_10075 [Solirubrobacterales bacterium]
MNAPPGPLSSKNVARTRDEIRGPEIGPALKRDVLLQKVRAARKRLAPIPNTVPRLR